MCSKYVSIQTADRRFSCVFIFDSYMRSAFIRLSNVIKKILFSSIQPKEFGLRFCCYCCCYWVSFYLMKFLVIISWNWRLDYKWMLYLFSRYDPRWNNSAKVHTMFANMFFWPQNCCDSEYPSTHLPSYIIIIDH